MRWQFNQRETPAAVYRSGAKLHATCGARLAGYVSLASSYPDSFRGSPGWEDFSAYAMEVKGVIASEEVVIDRTMRQRSRQRQSSPEPLFKMPPPMR